MNRLLICFFFFAFFSCVSHGKDNDSIFERGTNYIIYKSALTSEKISSQNLIKLIFPHERGVIFFYPEVDSLKRQKYDIQVRELAKSEGFKDAIVIGIPFIEAKTDAANVWLDSYIVTDVQCIIYTNQDKNLFRALKMNTAVIRDTKNMPPKFSRIDINKEQMCVKENRIIFFENFLAEFLSPKYSMDEKLDMFGEKQDLLLQKIEAQHEQIEALKKEVLNLKKELDNKSSEGKKQ